MPVNATPVDSAKFDLTALKELGRPPIMLQLLKLSPYTVLGTDLGTFMNQQNQSQVAKLGNDIFCFYSEELATGCTPCDPQQRPDPPAHSRLLCRVKSLRPSL
jgi:hypothetical protein